MNKVEKLRQKYPVGTKIKLVFMDDFHAPPSGTIGEVVYVDDAENIHVHWQNGSALAVIEGVDKFEILTNSWGEK